MKQTIYFLLALFSISIFLTSCEKENEIPDSGEEVKLYPRSIQNDLTEQITQAGNILNAHWGDQELINAMINSYDEQCIEEFLLYELIENSHRSSDYWEELNDLVLNNPLITIAFPSYAFRDHESFEEHLSNIDYTVLLFDNPDDVNYLVALNSNNQIVNISSKFNEEKNYCVIKSSEQYLAMNTGNNASPFGEMMPSNLAQFTPQLSIGPFNIYWTIEGDIAQMIDRGELDDIPEYDYLVQLNSCDRDEYEEYLDPRDGEGCDELCDRDCPPKTKDELHRIKWSSKKAVKVYENGFHLPNLELYSHYVIPTFISTNKVEVKVLPKYIVGHWKDMTGDWSEPLKLEIVEWALEENMAEDWQVTWFERDYWNTVTEKFSIGFSVTGSYEGTEASATVGYDLSIKKKDKCIGSSMIEYCDPALGEGYEYHPFSFLPDGSDGGFWFREHVKNQ